MFFPSATNDQVADAILEGLTNLPVTVTHTRQLSGGRVREPDAREPERDERRHVHVQRDVRRQRRHARRDVRLHGRLPPERPRRAARRSDETITITVPAPDLAIAKTGPALVTEGNNVVYTLTATESRADDRDRRRRHRSGACRHDLRLGGRRLRPRGGRRHLHRRDAEPRADGDLHVHRAGRLRATSSSTPPRSPGTSPTRTWRTTRRRSRPRSTSTRSAPRRRRGSGTSGPRTTSSSTDRSAASRIRTATP